MVFTERAWNLMKLPRPPYRALAAVSPNYIIIIISSQSYRQTISSKMYLLRYQHHTSINGISTGGRVASLRQAPKAPRHQGIDGTSRSLVAGTDAAKCRQAMPGSPRPATAGRQATEKAANLMPHQWPRRQETRPSGETQRALSNSLTP